MHIMMFSVPGVRSASNSATFLGAVCKQSSCLRQFHCSHAKKFEKPHSSRIPNGRRIASSGLAAADVETRDTANRGATGEQGQVNGATANDASTSLPQQASSDSWEEQEEEPSSSGQTDSQSQVQQQAGGGGRPESRGRYQRTGATQRPGGYHTQRYNTDRRPPLRQNMRNWRRGPVQDFPFRIGDVVLGKVVAGTNGWRIALEYDEEILGFCPTTELPHVLKDSIDAPSWGRPPIGLKREFLIRDLPPQMEYHGKGPLLSARIVDHWVIWRRAAQIREVCSEERDNIAILAKQTNTGGLLGAFEGLPVFIPWSFIPRLMGGQVKDKEAVAAQYLGAKVNVSIVDVDQKMNRFVGNIIEAQNNKAFATMKVGDLIWGTVDSIERYGVFVRAEEFPSVRGLLHIANISRAHVDRIDDVFHHGERVRAVITGMDEPGRRVSLSTAELEVKDGDILFNKAGVYEHAEETVDSFRRYVADMQAKIESGDYLPPDDNKELEWDT